MKIRTAEPIESSHKRKSEVSDGYVLRIEEYCENGNVHRNWSFDKIGGTANQREPSSLIRRINDVIDPILKVENGAPNMRNIPSFPSTNTVCRRKNNEKLNEERREREKERAMRSRSESKKSHDEKVSRRKSATSPLARRMKQARILKEEEDEYSRDEKRREIREREKNGNQRGEEMKITQNLYFQTFHAGSPLARRMKQARILKEEEDEYRRDEKRRENREKEKEKKEEELKCTQKKYDSLLQQLASLNHKLEVSGRVASSNRAPDAVVSALAAAASAAVCDAYQNYRTCAMLAGHDIIPNSVEKMQQMTEIDNQLKSISKPN